MQIVCDQCGKKYKTREKKTKPFKIRCTQCPNVFIIDPTKLPDEEATRQVSTEMAASLLKPKAEAPAAQVNEWYAVVQDQQAGPFNLGQLQEMWSQGQLNAQSYVWREGMAGWEPITSVPELAQLHSAASAAASQRGQQREAQQREAQQREAQQREAQQREAQQREAQQREAQQREAQQREAQQRQQVEIQHSPSLVVNKSTSPKREESVLSSTESPVLEHKEPSAVLTTAQLKNQRNDNSVLFSLDSIEGLTSSSPSSSEPSRQSPVVSNTGGSDGSGLIDISALGTGFGEQSSPDGGRATINLTSGMKRPPMMSKSSNNLPLILASMLLTALASAAGFYFFVFVPQNAVTQAPVNTKIQINQGALATNSTVAVKSQESAQLAVSSLKQAEPAPSEPASSEQTPGAQESNESPKASSAESAAPSPKKTRASSRSKARSSRRSKSKPKPKAKPKPRAKRASPATKRAKAPPKPKSGGGEASSLLSSLRGGGSKRSSSGPIPGLGASSGKKLPKKPNKDDIKKAMRRVNVARCAKYSADLKGKTFVQIRIVSNGSVRSAEALAPFKGTPTGKCLEGEVRKQRVPPFSDSHISFKFPFMVR